MKPCLRCGTSNSDEHKFCQQCGQALNGLPATVGATADATVRWQGRLPRVEAARKTVPIGSLFARKNDILIGRAPECDVVLPHPSISRHHARLERLPEGFRLYDLQSVNGIFVNGRRLEEPVLLQPKQLVGIGPFLFRLADDQIYVLDNSQSLRLQARGLEKTVTAPTGERRKLLNDVNLVVEPGEFVSLLGPSGSGKSTLMDCLNGRRPATGGTVLANGENFYLHFDSFRQSLGYVPQRDIVHTQISVYRALYYTARLRLPTDTDHRELTGRIEEVLDQMELAPHRATMIGSLSGGQIKRVSLGAELLARPCLLYIDEATSGLDAGTEARMMHLFRHLADEGKSVICITHNVDNVDLCNLILVLARGRLVYYGPPREARSWFGVGRISEIYDRLATRDPEAWQKQFAASSLHEEFVAKRLAAADGGAAAADSGPVPPPPESVSVAPPAKRRPPLLHQFLVLTARYLELIWRDRQSLRLLLLQAPIVAIFILLGFSNKPYSQKVLSGRPMQENERKLLEWVNSRVQPGFEQKKAEIAKDDPDGSIANFFETLKQLPQTEGPVVPDRLIVNPRFTYILLFLFAIIILWFGCNNAAKEIVKEESIYSRERAVNLGILPYLASKFLVLSVITAVQALLLMLLVYGTMEVFQWQLGWSVPWPDYRLAYPSQLAVLSLLGMTGVALGLLLSASASTPERATTLLPYVLIPQVILGGGILTIKSGPLFYAAVLLSPAYWGYRAIRRGESRLPQGLEVHMDYDDNLWIPCAALAAQIGVLLLLTTLALRAKDIRRA